MPTNYDVEYPKALARIRELKDEVRRLTSILEDAPHEPHCQSKIATGGVGYGSHAAQRLQPSWGCNCWKSKLGGE
jgi:hypothetical protein